ncbi:MAG: Na+/H+ antiporter NhaC family protein [Fusobacteriaceae bacterium]|jgi:Na+/H+ antiporter NhaC|nr:Na+/H+ antiporter NhaC family protein [Fusobacteriaceae bacterium]
MENNQKNSFLGLVPFLIFIALYVGTGAALQLRRTEMAFYQLPSPVAVAVGIIFAFVLFRAPVKEKFETFLAGCGHQDIMTMCIIYLLAGAFAGVSKAAGGVDATVNLGLTYIPARFIAAGLFMISCFISTATGTSVGSIVAIAPIAVGLAEKSGVSLLLVLASVMGGAMFGDNLSVISDTTIAATRTQGVEMRDKFRINLYIALPAALLTIVLLLIFGRPDHLPTLENLSWQFSKVLPYLVVLALALAGINVFIVLTAGVILSGAIGLYNGNFTFLTLSKEIYQGFLGMVEIFLLSLLTGGLAALSAKAGGIRWLLTQIQKVIVGKKSAKAGIGLLVAVTDIAVANNTVAIIINGPIARQICEKYQVDPRESAAVLDIFSCIFQGMIPYGAQMLILLGFAGEKISPLSLIPLLWYQILLLVFTAVFIYFSLSDRIIARLDRGRLES